MPMGTWTFSFFALERISSSREAKSAPLRMPLTNLEFQKQINGLLHLAPGGAIMVCHIWLLETMWTCTIQMDLFLPATATNYLPHRLTNITPTHSNPGFARFRCSQLEMQAAQCVYEFLTTGNIMYVMATSKCGIYLKAGF